MNYWIISDTHFGHESIKVFGGRPDDFERIILDKLRKALKPDDILIHLGDVSWIRNDEWHSALIESTGAYKYWLIRGNHDTKGYNWYLNQGWDFIGEQATIKYGGRIIALSHKPIADSGYDLNIHGHFHNLPESRHEPELVAIKNDKQFLFTLEHHYSPMSLKTIVKRALK